MRRAGRKRVSGISDICDEPRDRAMRRRNSGIDSDVTDTTDDVIAGALTGGDGNHVDGIGGVVGAENQLGGSGFNIADGAGSVARPGLADGVDVGFASAVGRQGIVVAVEKQGGAGEGAGVHAHSLLLANLDDDEALPAGLFAFDLRTETAEETLSEFEDVSDLHVHDDGLRRGDARFGNGNGFELVIGNGRERRAAVDLGGVDEVEDGKALDGQDAIHAFDAEPALAIEEVGDVRLLKAGLLGEMETGELAGLDALEEQLAEIFLQGAEFHGGTIA